MYTVIGFPGTRAFRILWMLDELDVPYRIEPLMPGSVAARAATGGRLPALRADGEVLLDSVAILQFLADRHGRMLARGGTHERARQDAWTMRVSEQVDAPLTVMQDHMRMLPPEDRVVDIHQAAADVLERNLARIAAALPETRYLCGDELTVPDIVLGHCLRWSGRFFGRPLTDARLVRYFRRLEQRPAYLMAESA